MSDVLNEFAGGGMRDLLIRRLTFSLCAWVESCRNGQLNGYILYCVFFVNLREVGWIEIGKVGIAHGLDFSHVYFMGLRMASHGRRLLSQELRTPCVDQVNFSPLPELKWQPSFLHQEEKYHHR